MAKEELGLQFFGDHLVLGELRSIVRSDGVHPPLVRQEHPDDGLRQAFGVLSQREFLHQQESRFSFREGDDGSLAVFSHDRVDFPITEPGAFVHHGGSFLYRHPVLDAAAAANGTLPVLEFVAQCIILNKLTKQVVNL